MAGRLTVGSGEGSHGRYLRLEEQVKGRSDTQACSRVLSSLYSKALQNHALTENGAR